MLETRRGRLESWDFFSSPPFCLCMCGNDEGFVDFLHVIAKSPPAFPK